MTKTEYLDNVLLTEDRGWLDHTDINKIASDAWDAATECAIECLLPDWGACFNYDFEAYVEFFKRSMKV